MSNLHRFVLDLEIDQSILAAHDGEVRPPPNDPADWDVSDILAAMHAGIVEPANSLVVDYEEDGGSFT